MVELATQHLLFVLGHGHFYHVGYATARERSKDIKGTTRERILKMQIGSKYS